MPFASNFGLLVVAAGLLACGNGTMGPGVVSDTPLALTMTAATVNPAGTDVTVEMQLENVSNDPFTGGFPGAGSEIFFDVTATAADGEVVWRYIETHGRRASATTRTIEARAKVALAARWELTDKNNKRVAPGVYVLRGTVSVLPANATSEIEVRSGEIAIAVR